MRLINEQKEYEKENKVKGRKRRAIEIEGVNSGMGDSNGR